MTTCLLVLGIWVTGLVAMCLWDAFIGLGVEFDGYDNPPLALVVPFWPIAVPCLLVYAFTRLLESIKDKRKEREEKREDQAREQKKIRIAAEKEEKALLLQIEKELEDERKRCA